MLVFVQSARGSGRRIPRQKSVFYTLSIALLLTCTALAQKPPFPATEEHLALIARASEHERAALENSKPYRYQERLDWNWGSETRSDRKSTRLNSSHIPL